MLRRIRALSTSLALVLLTWVAAPALAQQPRGEAARREVEALRFELRREALERVVRAIEGRLRATQPDRAALVRGKQVADAFVRAHQDASLSSVLAELFRPELSSGRLSKADLEVDRELSRAYEKAFKLRSIDPALVPAERTGFAPPRTSGYLPEVAAIDPTAPHSMHDLRDYLSDRYTNAALERIVTGGHRVEIHVGSEAEALADLRNRGFTVAAEVRSPNGNYERLLLAEGPTGELRYVVTGTLDGIDRVRHLSSLLRFAGQGGVPSERVEIVGDVDALKARHHRAMVEALTHMGQPGGMALIGFRMTLRRELTERALARRGAEHLRDVLGGDPYEGLLQRLRAERDRAQGQRRARLAELVGKVEADVALADGLRRAPADVFGKLDHLQALQRAEATLSQLRGSYQSEVLGNLLADGKLRLPGGVSAADATISRPLEAGQLKADELRVRTGKGVETLKLVSNYYGDAMSDVVRALLDSGHGRLAYFGTAGGTGAGVKVGDIHVPERVYDFRNDLTSGGVKNEFLDHLAGRDSPLGERLRVGTNLGNVFSPVVETGPWLEDVRARGLHAIEVENSYITREVARHNAAAATPEARARLWTSLIISDVPGSEHTLGNNNGATRATFERMVDHYLEALGITDIELLEKEAAKAPNRPLARDDASARALEVADRLVPDAGRSTFLRDRVAGILGALDAEALSSLPKTGRLRVADLSGLPAEARGALEAELARPYADAEALRSLERADVLLSRLSAELAARQPGASYGLRLGGGVERGAFSPAAGVTLEVTGAPEARAAAAAVLESLRGEVAGAPPVRLGEAGPDALELGRGEGFRSDPALLRREHASRALTRRGVVLRGDKVEYAGRRHDPTARPGSLFSRYETYSLGPVAEAEYLRRFEERVGRHGGRVEYVPGSDPRLAGGQGRTLLAADGSPLVLLPSDRPVHRYALVDELTHVNQIERMRAELGTEAVRGLFAAAEAGDPAAAAKLLEWEIRARRMVLLTLPAGSPDRAVVEREIERLRRVLDPYLDARTADGRLDWSKVRRMAREHAAGAGSFLLGLFLKELAVLVESGDRAQIEAFFEGLATTEFWTEYGLFAIGAEAGSAAYGRFLQRYVRPSFVSTVLRSNVALATGMALPMIVHGRFDGRTFAVNLTGLMVSSTAVSAGLATLRWVTPLDRLASVRGMGRVFAMARGVPGWVYAGAQTAVVLYFGEKISNRLSAWLDEREARRDVGRAAEGVLEAARRARGADDAGLRAALEESLATYSRWRDRALAPALAASERLQRDIEGAGREAAIAGTAVSRYHELASRYPALAGHVARHEERNEGEVEERITGALERFAADRDAGLRRAYRDNRRGSAYDPEDGARDVSENRLQAYEDEAALYEAAARAARDPGAATTLREWAARTREIAARERALLDPDAPTAPTGPRRGIVDALGGDEQ